MRKRYVVDILKNRSWFHIYNNFNSMLPLHSVIKYKLTMWRHVVVSILKHMNMSFDIFIILNSLWYIPQMNKENLKDHNIQPVGLQNTRILTNCAQKSPHTLSTIADAKCFIRETDSHIHAGLPPSVCFATQIECRGVCNSSTSLSSNHQHLHLNRSPL